MAEVVVGVSKFEMLKVGRSKVGESLAAGWQE